MNRPCPHTFPIFRISVAMQRKLEFMFTKVKPGTHERHLEWFKKQVNNYIYSKTRLILTRALEDMCEFNFISQTQNRSCIFCRNTRDG